MRIRRSAAITMLLALGVTAGCGQPAAREAPDAIPSTTPAAYKFPRQPVLPPVVDATGLAGDRLVAASPLLLPDPDALGRVRLSAPGGRAYLLAPARRVAARAQPALVVLLPAANTNLLTEYDRYHLDALRDHGITVAVAGTYAASWNAGSCCGRAHADRIDDVAAVTAVRDDALRRSGADPGRVAVVGHSVGALMAWRLACTPGFRAAAVVAVAGTLVSDCPTRRDVPSLLALNGDQDRTVPLAGSASVVTVLGIAPPSVPASLATLARAAGCLPAARAAGGVTVHRGCRGGDLRLQVVPGVGHPWQDLDATRRAAAFLSTTLTGVR